MKKVIVAILILGGSLNIAPVEADVYNCQGIYQNQPCGAQKKDTTAAAAKALKSADENDKKALSRKRSLTHDLAMKAINANKQYRLSYNTAVIEDYCFDPAVSVVECDAKVSELSEKIDDRIASLEAIDAQKRANELNEEKLKKDSDPKVVVIQQPYFIHKRRPYPRRPSSGYGVNVEVGSKSGNTNVKGTYTEYSGVHRGRKSELYTGEEFKREGYQKGSKLYEEEKQIETLPAEPKSSGAAGIHKAK